MNEAIQSLLTNEQERLQRTINQMQYRLENADTESTSGMERIIELEQRQLKFLTYLEEKAQSGQEVMDALRIYLQAAEQEHETVDYTEDRDRWYDTLNDLRYASYLLDQAHVRLGNFDTPETQISADLGTRRDATPEISG